MSASGFPGATLRVISFVAITLLGSHTQAKCGLPADVSRLINTLHAASQEGTHRHLDLAARLKTDAARINMDTVSRKLFSVGMQRRSSSVENLIKDVEDIQLQGSVIDPQILREHIKQAEHLDNLVCELEKIQEDMPASENASKVGQTRTRTDVPYSTQDVTEMRNLALLLGSVSFLILLIMLGKYAYFLIFALTHNRRSCRIPVALEQWLDVGGGHRTVIGYKGCRFQPVNQGA